MKNILLIITMSVFCASYSFSAAKISECDKLTGILKTGAKIDCQLAEKRALKKSKGTGLGQKSKKGVTVITNTLEKLEKMKKKFDDENSTLIKMFKKNEQ